MSWHFEALTDVLTGAPMREQFPKIDITRLDRQLDELPGGRLDRDLAPVLEKLGAAMLRGEHCTDDDMRALIALANSDNLRCRVIAERILSSLRRKAVSA